MNKFFGVISEIETDGSLSWVTIEQTPKMTFKSLVIDTPKTATYLAVGNKVEVLFKETEVVIGTVGNDQLSLFNCIPGTLEQIVKEKFLSKLTLNTAIGGIIAIITSDSIDRLELRENIEVYAMINPNQVMLKEWTGDL